MFYTPEEKGLSAEEINKICEDLWEKQKPHNCHDCGVKPGKRHIEWCDVARCTSCGGQRLACDCDKGRPDIWSGLFPGIKECYEQKLICYDTAMNINKWFFDLNSYYLNTIIKNENLN